jgi:murein DD-endopeptidase MepM/ murein hydrolase activator NlpD
MARKNRLRRHRKTNTGRTLLLFIASLLGIAALAGGFILFETESPQVAVNKTLTFLGSGVEVPISVTDRKSGLSSVVVALEQNGREQQIYSQSYQRKAWFGKAGPPELATKVMIDPRKAGIKDGQATLLVIARDFSLNGVFKGNETRLALPVTVDTKPPRVAINHAQKYIRPGGSGIVTYTLSEPVKRHGVEIDDLFFPGYPVKGSANRYVAFIALPWNGAAPEKTQVIALDEAGNKGKAVFAMNFKKTVFKKDRINISDGFLKRKIPEFEVYYPELTGTMLEKYIYINNEVRRQNAEAIKKVCQQTEPERFWSDRFIRIPGAGRAGFADQRTYYYKGQVIDHQTHLGMDIASTARVGIKAANRGKVVFADYLGIYGNMVILDHGQGLFSLYAHLSSIDTTPGALVEKNQLIAHSGATGMAGGDHLHFSILVHGIFVTPKEWWDQHWIDVNINSVLGK